MIGDLDMKALVAYFSASGVTEHLAKKLANAIGADLHEIIPAQKYTQADLDWTNKKSRSTIEMNDKKYRPEIANRVDNMEQYDTIFVGFPIWWYVAPTIINTFLERYDLTGKKIIPFATSGGSGMGKTNKELADSCKGAILLEGKRFGSGTSEAELKTWAGAK
jgi:flavodoxin